MRKLTMAFVMALTLAGADGLVAQTATGNASVTIPQVLMIASVTDLTIASTGFDFSAGNTSTASGSATVNTRANVQHSVEVTGANLSNGTDPLTLNVQAFDGTWAAVSATAVKVVSGAAKGPQASTVNFQATADVALHSPGAYTGSITYTVISGT